MDLYFSAAPGPSDWYIKWERCGGNRQSPINIDTTRVRERKYRTLKIEFDNSGGLVAGDLENNGNYPTFSVDKSKGTARSAYRHVRTERVPRALRVRKRTGI